MIASGNSGRPGSKHVTDHFATWLRGEHHTVSLLRDELTIEETWHCTLSGVSYGFRENST